MVLLKSQSWTGANSTSPRQPRILQEGTLKPRPCRVKKHLLHGKIGHNQLKLTIETRALIKDYTVLLRPYPNCLVKHGHLQVIFRTVIPKKINTQKSPRRVGWPILVNWWGPHPEGCLASLVLKIMPSSLVTQQDPRHLVQSLVLIWICHLSTIREIIISKAL